MKFGNLHSEASNVYNLGKNKAYPESSEWQWEQRMSENSLFFFFLFFFGGYISRGRNGQKILIKFRTDRREKIKQ